MKKTLRFTIILAILLTSVGCDQVAKSAARHFLSPYKPLSFCADLVRLEYVENPGAFMSIGEDLPSSARKVVFVFLICILLAMFAVIVRTYSKMNLLEAIGVALSTGGIAGNLIDRIINDGRVVDFANLGIGPLRTGIFNIADVAILVGAGLFIIGSFWIRERSTTAA
ncbi:MAG TPA: signal peptidase II [Blastocatellia bacterium]|nr:signal peptidase II [Blastocatellia bacterium]